MPRAGSEHDRTVHATMANGTRIVRYDRAGKWYAESSDGDSRAPLSFRSAVFFAARPGSYVYLGKPGGRRFDAAVKAAGEAKAEHV